MLSDILYYRYYDTPEGQDILKKTFYVSKYTAGIGATLAFFDVLMVSHPKGIIRTVGRYLYIVGPLVGCAAAFSVTANVVHNIREKDDKLNYFLGGAAAGSIVGAWTRSAVFGVPMAFILGMVGIAQKIARERNCPLFPDVSHVVPAKSVRSRHHDWTLIPDVEELKGWTTGEEEKKL